MLEGDKRQPGKMIMRNRVPFFNMTIEAEILDPPGFLGFRVAWAFDSSDPCKYVGCQHSFGWENSQNPLT